MLLLARAALVLSPISLTISLARLWFASMRKNRLPSLMTCMTSSRRLLARGGYKITHTDLLNITRPCAFPLRAFFFYPTSKEVTLQSSLSRRSGSAHRLWANMTLKMVTALLLVRSDPNSESGVHFIITNKECISGKRIAFGACILSYSTRFEVFYPPHLGRTINASFGPHRYRGQHFVNQFSFSLPSPQSFNEFWWIQRREKLLSWSGTPFWRDWQSRRRLLVSFLAGGSAVLWDWARAPLEGSCWVAVERSTM